MIKDNLFLLSILIDYIKQVLINLYQHILYMDFYFLVCHQLMYALRSPQFATVLRFSIEMRIINFTVRPSSVTRPSTGWKWCVFPLLFLFASIFLASCGIWWRCPWTLPELLVEGIVVVANVFCTGMVLLIVWLWRIEIRVEQGSFKLRWRKIFYIFWRERKRYSLRWTPMVVDRLDTYSFIPYELTWLQKLRRESISTSR